MTDPLRQRVEEWMNGLRVIEGRYLPMLVMMNLAEALIRDLVAALDASEANLAETHTAWNRENDLRHEAEADRQRLRSALEGLDRWCDERAERAYSHHAWHDSGPDTRCPRRRSPMTQSEHADALKLLDALLAPCEGADAHSWLRCKRCTAMHGLEMRFPVTMRLMGYIKLQFAEVPHD